jgi:hypothetical protein
MNPSLHSSSHLLPLSQMGQAGGDEMDKDEPKKEDHEEMETLEKVERRPLPISKEKLDKIAITPKREGNIIILDGNDPRQRRIFEEEDY